MIVFPKWLYEPLPYLYVAAGIATILGLGSLPAVFSGVMLIIAGFTTASMRYRYRQKLKQRERLLALQRAKAEKDRRQRSERQAWLREQAEKVREEIRRKEEDF